MRRFSKKALGAVAALALLTAISACSSGGDGSSTVRAKPYPALAKPTIQETMTLDEARELVKKATQPTTTWDGPTTGPKASRGKKIVYVSCDQSTVACSNWAKGIKVAGDLLSWDVTVIDGKGTVSGTLNAFNQALALNPAAIITSADVGGQQVPVQQAVSRNIPVIGMHSSAYPGPNPRLGLYDNIATNPADIGRAQAAFVIAESGGTPKLLHMLDSSFEIARFKAKAAEDPIKNLSGAKFLGEINIPFGDQATQIPTAVSGLVSRYGGQTIYMTTCCDTFLPAVASALRSLRVPPEKVRLVGADGAASAYDMIRKGDYEIATVPEPSSLFGYMAVDSAVRALAGVKPSTYSPSAYLVTKANVDEEGGDKAQYDPSNGFACHYANIWLGKHDDCSKK